MRFGRAEVGRGAVVLVVFRSLLSILAVKSKNVFAATANQCNIGVGHVAKTCF